MRLKKLIFLLLLFSPILLNGEIEKITIEWKNEFCNADCANLIQKTLLSFNEVKDLSVSVSGGSAAFRWDSNQPFTYQWAVHAMARVGVKIHNIAILAKGTAREQGDKVVLISSKDNTSFVLVSPLPPNPNEYTPKPNPLLMKLSPGTKAAILEQARQGKIATVEGSLYLPSQSPPLVMQVTRVQFEKPKE